MLSDKENKLEVIETFFDEVWSKENKKAIWELFVPEEEGSKTAAGLRKEEKMGPEDFEGFHTTLLSLIQEVKITVDHSVIDNDWISARCTLHAKSKKTNEPVTITGSAMARITDGKIRQAYNYFDFLHLFEGLGQLPQDTMKILMEGGEIAGSTPNLTTP